MILGIGSDIVDIRRIEKALKRFGQRFEKRVFTEAEREKANGRAATYAKRFAAKEACAKALGTGFNYNVLWHDIEVINKSGGAPNIRLSGGAGDKLQSLTPHGMQAKIHVTLSDEYPFAQAMVLIEALAI